jgi:hypothetical protein
LIDGLAGFYLGKGCEKFARPVAMALAVVAAVAIAGALLYWRRKEQQLARQPQNAPFRDLCWYPAKSAELTIF